MKGHNRLDPIDRNILRILSLYEELDLFQLWCELGESDATGEFVTREQVLSKLESLKLQGLVERVMDGEGRIRWTSVLQGEVER
jgi:hypothetical protein